MIDDENIDGDDEGASKTVAVKKQPELQCFIGIGNNPRIVRDALSQ